MNKQYVKLVNGTPVYFKNPIVDGDTQIYNPNSDVLLSYGYKEFVRNTQDPQLSKMSIPRVLFVENETTIEQTYEYTFDRNKAQKYFTDMIQNYLDERAKQYGYDSCLSVCSYINTGIPKFDAEGEAFRQWRSSVWSYGYQLLEETTTQEEIPTDAEFIAGLPQLRITYPVQEEDPETTGSQEETSEE